jgi:predicted hydrocarbon binding protein
MATKMSYQGASNIRGQKLSDMLYGNLVSGDQSIGGSIRSAVSDKMRASAMGIKEKFDPLNIARMFGGRFGTALAGRAMGRSKEDISYFANRGKKGLGVKESPADDKNDPLYTKVAEGEQRKSKKGDSISDVMGRIYNLIKHDSEEAKTQLELEHDKRDKHESIREKWHKELIKAIMSGAGGTAQPEKKDKDKGFFGMLQDIFGKVMGVVDGIIDSLSGAYDTIKKIMARVGEMIGKVVGKVKEWVVAAYEFAKGLVKKVADKLVSGFKWVADTIGELASKFLPNSFVEKIKNSYKSIEEGIAGFFKKFGGKTAEKVVEKEGVEVAEKAVGKSLLKKIPFLGIGAGLFFGAEKALDGDWIGAGMEVASGAVGSIPVVGTAASVAIDAASAVRDASKESAPTAAKVTPATSTPAPAPAPATPPAPVTASPAPAAPSAVSTKAQAVIQENNDMKLDESTSPKVISIDNSKTVAGGGGGSAPPIALDGSVSLRTDDSTLQKIQKQNLRPV